MQYKAIINIILLFYFSIHQFINTCIGCIFPMQKTEKIRQSVTSQSDCYWNRGVWNKVYLKKNFFYLLDEIFKISDLASLPDPSIALGSLSVICFLSCVQSLRTIAPTISSFSARPNKKRRRGAITALCQIENGPS